MAKYPNVDYGLRNFAVLHHTGIEEPHYDFMFDTADDSQLITFRLQQWPVLQSQPAVKLRDHRRAYLSFQGAIPSDRGHVQRVDQGMLRVIETASGWLLNFADGKPFALLEPQACQLEQEEQWFFTLLADGSGSVGT